MPPRQSIGIRRRLNALLPPESIERHAAASTLIRRRRKLEPQAMFWTLVLGFGERKRERRLIVDYRRMMEEVIADLTQDNHAIACQLAELPDRVRGYGHIKERSIEAFEQERERLLQAFRSPPARVDAAA